jgi:TrmH family RNA methyltransferase
MKSKRWHWRVVLVRPRNPLNIGAAARAMANFGFEDLVVVAPHAPVWQETRSAVGAEQIVRSARALPELPAALRDVTLVVGTTSGSRRNLDRELIALADLPAWLQRHASAHARAALLFGSEKTGLSNQQMSYCQALVRIPTSPRCPSMNLGQAVAVCCYELARAGAVRARPPVTRLHLSEPAGVQSLEHVFERAARVLDAVGYLKPKSRNATLVKLRRLLLGQKLTNHDAKILGGILAQIEWKLEMQKTEVRSQKAEGRRQKTEGRRQKAEGRAPSPED